MMIPSLSSLLWKDLWLQTPSQTELFFAVVILMVNLIIMTVVFYLAGIIVVGKQRALLSEALVISLLGTIVSSMLTLPSTNDWPNSLASRLAPFDKTLL